MKRLFIFVFLVSCALRAQTVVVTAQHLGGTTPITGTVCFQPTLASGLPASVQMGGGGQTASTPICAWASAGAFSVTLPDTLLTNPQNLCFSVTAVSQGKQMLGNGYRCVQPHGGAVNSGDWCQAGACNFDQYIPNLAALPVMYAPSAISQTLVADAGTVTLAIGNRPISIFALPLNASIATRALNAIGLLKNATFTLLISPDPTATDPVGISFGSGCVWQAATGSGLGSLANGIVIPPGTTSQIILAVVFDGTNCNVTEVQ